MQQTISLLVYLIGVVFFDNNFQKAESYFKQEKYDAAKELFLKVVKAEPNNYKSLEYLGDIYGVEKNWDKCIEYYQVLKNKFPQNANYWYKYGGAIGMKAKNANKFKALTLIDEIEDSFLKAAKLDENHIDARWALVTLYLELPGIVGGSEKKAQTYAHELMQLSKVDGFLSKGYIDEYFNRYSKAEINYLQAHKIGNSKTTYEKLYFLYLNKLKDPKKASQLKESFYN